MNNELIERLQYIADSPDREHGGFHAEAVQTAKDAIAELTALREFVASLNSFQFEEWYGSHKTIDGKFTIFDSDGNCVASGDNALLAWQEFERLK
jgi:hypothetical protein